MDIANTAQTFDAERTAKSSDSVTDMRFHETPRRLARIIESLSGNAQMLAYRRSRFAAD